MSKPKPIRGRPVGTTTDRPLLNRHVVNIDAETESAIEEFAKRQAFVKKTDAMRSLIVKALRAEGLM